MLLTLQFAEEERLATPPLSIQAYSDGRVEGGLTQNVRQSTAVHLISKQVLTIISIQISWQKGKRTKWVTFSPTKFSLVSKVRVFLLTVSKYLCKDPFLVVGINVVGGFPCLVGPIQQTTVSRVTQKKLSDSLASSPQRNMEPCISSLKIVENVHEAYIQMSYSLIYGFIFTTFHIFSYMYIYCI